MMPGIRPALERVHRIVGALPRGAQLNRRLFSRSDYFCDEAYVVSFPKCGRTWLRLMIGRALATHFAVDASVDEMLALKSFSRRCAGVAPVSVTHEDRPHERTGAELARSKERFRHKRVILLIRDVRDVMVSYYFQVSKRDRHRDANGQDLDTFVRGERGSLDSFLTYYRIWADNRAIPREFMLLKYEDLKSDPVAQLRRVMHCVGVADVTEATLQDAVQFAAFDNMRKLESSGENQRRMLQPGQKDDPESYKVRRGKVGGFRDYLTPETIRYINERATAELPEFYGYQFAD
jgi:hypothetical protein